MVALSSVVVVEVSVFLVFVTGVSRPPKLAPDTIPAKDKVSTLDAKEKGLICKDIILNYVKVVNEPIQKEYKKENSNFY